MFLDLCIGSMCIHEWQWSIRTMNAVFGHGGWSSHILMERMVVSLFLVSQYYGRGLVGYICYPLLFPLTNPFFIKSTTFPSKSQQSNAKKMSEDDGTLAISPPFVSHCETESRMKTVDLGTESMKAKLKLTKKRSSRQWQMQWRGRLGILVNDLEMASSLCV